MSLEEKFRKRYQSTEDQNERKILLVLDFHNKFERLRHAIDEMRVGSDSDNPGRIPFSKAPAWRPRPADSSRAWLGLVYLKADRTLPCSYTLRLMYRI
jgi:hypothetical protein